MKTAHYIRLFFVFLVWSSDFILGKYLVGYMDPILSVAIRFSFASALQLVLLFAKHEFVLPPYRDLFILFVIGVCVVGVRYPLSYIALQYTSPVNSALIGAFTPALTAVAALLFLRQKIQPTQMLFIALSVIGVIFIVLGEPSSLANITTNPVDFLILFGTVLWSIYNVAGKSVMKRLTPLQASFYTCFFGLFIMWPLAFHGEACFEISAYPLNIWLCLFYIGLVGSGLGMYWWNSSIREMGTLKPTLLYNTIPLFTAILSFLFFQSIPNVTILFGGVLILVGSIFITLTNEKK